MPIAENLGVSKETPDLIWSHFCCFNLEGRTISSPTTWMAHGNGKSPFLYGRFRGSEIFPGWGPRDASWLTKIDVGGPGSKDLSLAKKHRKNVAKIGEGLEWSSYDHPMIPKTFNVSNVIDHQNPQIPPQDPPQCFFALQIFEQKAWYQVLAPCASIKQCNPIQSAAPQGHGRFEVHSHIIHGILAELGWFVKCYDSCLLQDFDLNNWRTLGWLTI